MAPFGIKFPGVCGLRLDRIFAAACFVFIFGAVLWAENADQPAISASWLQKAPGMAEAGQIELGARRHGWPAMALALRRAATGLYTRGQIPLAESWYYAARWAEIFGESEAACLERWRDAMRREGLPMGRFAAEHAPDEPLSARLSRDLQIALLADGTFSAAYFEIERQEDYRPEVLAILDRLRSPDPAVFQAYASLALALAVVYDVSPPPYWPHGQVAQTALPRRLPAPEDAWAFLISTDREGKSLHRMRQLDAAELRFLVDLAAPQEELRWAQANVKFALARLSDTYSSIDYKIVRAMDGVYQWPGADYSLQTIKKEGGICVDQAYFATQTGKARGVPTLLFSGTGQDVRHAWFGYLGVGRRWNLDAGRYEAQKFVTGVAYDPQTWGEISDHELMFMTEGFRRQADYRTSRVHGWFARWLLEDGSASKAAAAARAAAGLERRNLEAWEVLRATIPGPGAAREALLREAAGGLQAYPDLQAGFLRELAGSLRQRGEIALAEQEERGFARKFQAKRLDLSVRQVAEQMVRARETLPVEEQIRLYRNLVRRFGRGAGIGFFDEVARPLIADLVRQERFKEAREVSALAAQNLDAGPGTQLGDELRCLDNELRAAAEAKKTEKNAFPSK